MSIVEYEYARAQTTPRLKELFTDMRITRLARRISQFRRLDDHSKTQTLLALQDYKQTCKNYRVDKILAVATSALREATDGPGFIGQIQNSLGIAPRIISGEREAYLTTLATQYEFSNFRQFILLDVGGGSTEIVESVNGEILHFHSLPLGTVRNTETWIHSDPPAPEDVQIANSLLRKMLSGFEFRSENLISVGGTATTLYCVKHSIEPYKPEHVHHGALSLKELFELRTLFQGIPLKERKKLRGLHPERADVIWMGSLIIEQFMKLYGFNIFNVSDRGVRWGLIYDYLRSIGATSA